MKKFLLTAVIAFSTTLFASAQFMIVTTYDGDRDGGDQLMAKAGVGYMATDAFTIGMQRDGDEKYDLFLRYNVKDQIFATFMMPTKDGSDKMSGGIGFSFQVYEGLYFDPNYTMPFKEDPVTKKREGSANFSLSYRF
tara:strand:- start:61 stop:471 length:411 start_codon:yes stop_codon:yes gene_type:complete